MVERARSVRDTHERGLRGPLVLPDVTGRLPQRRPLSRRDSFDDLVVAVVDGLLQRWGRELAGIDFGTEDVPDVPMDWDGEPVPFGALIRPRPGAPGRIVLFRRPIELRAPTKDERALLVHEVLVEHIAEYLGRDPDTIDP